jgi:hypothetical protein
MNRKQGRRVLGCPHNLTPHRSDHRLECATPAGLREAGFRDRLQGPLALLALMPWRPSLSGHPQKLCLQRQEQKPISPSTLRLVSCDLCVGRITSHPSGAQLRENLKSQLRRPRNV